MAKDASFHEYVVHDLLGDISGITSKAMFGGYGVYQNGKIFAIIAYGELYFKGNETDKTFFSEHGSRPFTYAKKNGKTYTMNYWFVPEEVYENRETLGEWVNMATEDRF